MGKQKHGIKKNDPKSVVPELWLRARYTFHTFAYRDPRSVFATAIGLPVVSPTTVLLGIASTLFSIGRAYDAERFLSNMHNCDVIIDTPDGIIFFRAFHQLRRYETSKYDDPIKGKVNRRIGLTKINQGTREYGLMDGFITVFVSITKEFQEAIQIALINLTHLGTHDSLCNLIGQVEVVGKPLEIVYLPSDDFSDKMRKEGVENTLIGSFTIVTLSRFKRDCVVKPISLHWWMAGGKDTELIRYVIPGRLEGTSNGKIYRKH